MSIEERLTLIKDAIQYAYWTYLELVDYDAYYSQESYSYYTSYLSNCYLVYLHYNTILADEQRRKNL